MAYNKISLNELYNNVKTNIALYNSTHNQEIIKKVYSEFSLYTVLGGKRDLNNNGLQSEITCSLLYTMYLVYYKGVLSMSKSFTDGKWHTMSDSDKHRELSKNLEKLTSTFNMYFSKYNKISLTQKIQVHTSKSKTFIRVVFLEKHRDFVAVKEDTRFSISNLDTDGEIYANIVLFMCMKYAQFINCNIPIKDYRINVD